MKFSGENKRLIDIIRYFCNMMNLSSYIERLLLDNDCVIIPEIGGFIAQTISAAYDEKQQLFIPPMRTVGFNAKLTSNDGLLIHAVMQQENLSYDDASKVVKQMSKEVLSTLHESGSIRFANVGTLRLNVYNRFEFSPEFQIASPALTGFEPFRIAPLSMLPKMEEKTSTVSVDTRKNLYEIHINRTFVHTLTAAAAAIALLFILSTPVKNTYVESSNYAQVMPIDLFQQIENRSMNVTPVKENAVQPAEAATILPEAADKALLALSEEDIADSIRKIRTKEVKVVPKKENAPQAGDSQSQAQKAKKEQTDTPKVKESATNAKQTDAAQAQAAQPSAVQVKATPFHLIVAGGISEATADKLVQKLKADGHFQAVKLQSAPEKYRVSIQAYSDRETAEQELTELRKNPSYKDAWLLVKRH